MYTLDEYIHERDAYYVINKLSLNHIGVDEEEDGPAIYDFKEHRSLDTPTFREQRKILEDLSKRKLIRINSMYGISNAKTNKLNVAVKFHITATKKVRELRDDMMLKLTEADLNRIAIQDHEKISLSLEDLDIFVTLPSIKLKVNKERLKRNNIPHLFLDYLINDADSAIVDRENCPLKTARNYDEIMMKAGFKGAVASAFLPVCSKDEIQLLTSTEVCLKDIVLVTRQLLKYGGYNQETYEHYMEGIE